MFDDLRGFIEACDRAGEVREVRGAHWDLQIGALVEATAELVAPPPLLVFDDIPGYPIGYRVASLLIGSPRRLALALDLPADRTRLELIRLATARVQGAKPIPPSVVRDGPIMEVVQQGADVDMFSVPAPRYHTLDGGRYIGTGDCIIMRDPDGGWVNMATYRVQVHEPGLLGLWMSPGQQGHLLCQKYWAQGRSCPVVAVFGPDLGSFTASRLRLPWGRSELDLAGGLRGRPLEVVDGPVTGLPIPAWAEIAIEGEVPPPDEEARDEGPFGEWTGYYSGGTLGTGKPQPVIRVQALYHRRDPILVDSSPLWPGAPRDELQVEAGRLWDQLDAAGVPDVVGVCRYTANLYVVAIQQRYAGHARQAGLAVLGCSTSARDSKYVVIVDDDIDPTNFQEVLWAMTTRVDPGEDIEIVHGHPATPLDPRLSPAKRSLGAFTHGCAIVYAVRPFEWRSQFPQVSRSDPELRREMIERFQHVIPFRSGSLNGAASTARPTAPAATSDGAP